MLFMMIFLCPLVICGFEKKEVQEDTTALKILFSIWGLRYSRGSVWVWERSRKDGIWQTMY